MRRLARRTIGLAVSRLLVAVPVGIAIVGPFVTPHDPTDPLGEVLAPPGTIGWLGTDVLGRDVWSRVLDGGRSVVLVSVAALLIAQTLGTAIGVAAGSARRFGRPALLACAEVFLAVPAVILLSALVTGFGRSELLLLFATAIALAPSLVPLVATATATLAGQPWVETAVLAGERRRAILRRELLPNLLPLVGADAGMRLVGAIFLVSTAGFLGFGPEPPSADWGLMIAEGRATMSVQPWPVIVPAVLITSFALGVNLLLHRRLDARTLAVEHASAAVVVR